ncbi:hypothetical protein ABEB36_004964 [Hypothenemus hampei]|uniref:Selenoprotein S n=1 Tax=Hypothenemus hampei TaxID=57062 RepID=A0ABD1EWG7_HYPHA
MWALKYLRSFYANLVEYLTYYWYLFQEYFWHLIIGGILFYYVYNKLIIPVVRALANKYDSFVKWRQDREYAAIYHKNPDLLVQKICARQETVQKLQEKYNKDAVEYQAKLKEKRERKVILEDKFTDAGYKLGQSNNENAKNKSLKSDHFPLMGQGSSSNYRPPKRSKCGGGGCGK